MYRLRMMNFISCLRLRVIKHGGNLFLIKMNEKRFKEIWDKIDKGLEEDPRIAGRYKIKELEEADAKLAKIYGCKDSVQQNDKEDKCKQDRPEDS